MRLLKYTKICKVLLQFFQPKTKITELIFPQKCDLSLNIEILSLSRLPWDAYAQAGFQINQVITMSF